MPGPPLRRVLFATPYPYLAGMDGGAEITLRETCALLPGFGIAPAVLCQDRTSQAPALAIDERQGYPVYRAARPVAALPAVIDAVRPDIVVVQSGRVGLLLAASIGKGVPVAVHLHNVAHGHAGDVLLPDPRIVYIANSRFTAARAGIGFGIEPDVIAPIVQPERYATAADAPRDEVLFVNPIHDKGVEIAFRAAEACPEIRFRFVENPPVPKPWRRLCAARAARAGNVTWAAAADDMRPCYARARLVLMPSVGEESAGRIVMEAQVSGIPAVASDRGGLPETTGDAGLLVPLHAPAAAWAEAVRRLWNDADLWQRMSDAARRRAADPDRDPQRLAQRFVAVLSEHVGRQGVGEG